MIKGAKKLEVSKINKKAVIKAAKRSILHIVEKLSKKKINIIINVIGIINKKKFLLSVKKIKGKQLAKIIIPQRKKSEPIELSTSLKLGALL